MRASVRTRGFLALLLAFAVLTAACGDDDSSDAEQAPTSEPPDEAEARGVGDECEAAAEADIEVAATWTGARPQVATGDPHLELDLSEAIDSDCVVLAPHYSEAINAPTPGLGSIAPVDGFVVRFEPAPPPTDLDRPDAPWWGEDRIRACVPVDGGRLRCTNIDFDVVRDDVARLAEGFGVDTLPAMLSPLDRDESRNPEVTRGGVARLQDALAAEWALRLLADSVDLPELPPGLTEACAADGGGDALIERGNEILDEWSALADVSAIELGTAQGQEPPEDLSEQTNAVLDAVGEWLACRI